MKEYGFMKKNSSYTGDIQTFKTSVMAIYCSSSFEKYNLTDIVSVSVSNMGFPSVLILII